jgi:hypothetical protein
MRCRWPDCEGRSSNLVRMAGAVVSPCTWPPSTGRLVPEHHQRRSPQRILTAHLSDELPDLAVDLGGSAVRARLPMPVSLKSSPVPADKSLRLDDDDSVQDRWEESVRPHQEQSINVPQPHAPLLLGLKTTNCWRKTRFSASSLARAFILERKTRTNRLSYATIARFSNTPPKT